MGRFKGASRRKRKGSYGFVHQRKMPTDTFVGEDLAIEPLEWAVTLDYRNMARNHCAAVFVTNLALYFAELGYKELIINNSISDTFKEIHEIVGDGPVPLLAVKAKVYFARRGYDLGYERVRSLKDLKRSIASNHPLGLLLTDGIVHWHWVMVLGWRKYPSHGKYLRIADGWNRKGNRFYPINNKLAWMWATEYFVK